MLDVLRVEKKYLLNLEEAAGLEDRLDKLMPRDVYGEIGGGYQVRSLYFDTPDDLDFYEKEEGYEYRKKIRLRIYSPQDKTAKLEMKEKQGEFQRKRSLNVRKEQAQEMILGNYACLLEYEGVFAQELYCILQRDLYRPKCMVEYCRKAFGVAENNIRITLDSLLQANEANYDLFSANIPFYPVDVYSAVTLEVKYNRFLLSYIKDAVSACDKVQISNSKYCMARRVSRGC